jgi:hypothetical protein
MLSVDINQVRTRRLGVDIGKVIIGNDTANPSKSIFGKEFLECPEIEGAIDTLGSLGSVAWRSQVYLVSKCDIGIQERTLLWLEEHDFYARTGIEKEHVYFCRQRSEKATIASRLLLTQFIDDKIDVLKSMPSSVWGKILFAPDKKVEPRSDMAIAKSWQEVSDILTNDEWPITAVRTTDHRVRA